MTLKRRIDALERADPAELSAGLRAWLGQPITEAERQALDAEPREPWSPPRRADLKGCSPELIAWLGAV